MKSVSAGVLLCVALASSKFLVSATSFQPLKRSKRMDEFSPKLDLNVGERAHRNSRQITIVGAGESMSDSDSMDDGSADSSSSDDSIKATGTKIEIPQINFYSSIPNAVGVIANGLLTLRELSAAMGTPLPIFIGSVPMVVFGFVLMFVPDLSPLGLPLFYPGGAEGDPLAAFPPLGDFSVDDLTDFDALKKVIAHLLLIPPGFF